MATKKRRSRRRRMGAAAALNLNSPVMKLVLVAGAYFLVADPVNTALDGVLSKVFKNPAAADGTVPAGVNTMGQYAAIGLEGFGGYMLMKKAGMLPKVAGAVLAGAALKRALKKFGVVTGYQSVPVIGGYQSVPVIGNGMPAQLQGYRVNGIGGYRVNGRQSSNVMGNAMDRGATSASELLG